MFRLGYYQFRPHFGNIKGNLNQVLKGLQNAQADLIVLPELPFSGYHFQSREEAVALAENPGQSATVEALVGLCRRQNFYLVTGFNEKQGETLYNSALLLGPEGLVHTYRKVHLFNDEKKWFAPGDTPFSVQTVRGVKIGMMICFDWIFPEACRSLAVAGAEVVCHPSNLVLTYCQQTMLSRCIENGIFAVTANRFGADERPHGTLNFTGQSQIVAPKGKLLHRSAAKRSELFITEIDPALARDKKMTALNDIMADRRPEFYGGLAKSE
ncbi:MAG TPA: nitrilase-related carbon-nitrogen hydrolase [Calditrichia bacterium]|nr:acyltransferase [Calditrichota bacterium]HQU71654.1 nitrilase-related carbon-nitrogen hydrolase [Calditrichia bacterium]HQV32431.1 nitrilase-related carbon-nitrogen hydrolase [Calditrichia bacterium]